MLRRVRRTLGAPFLRYFDFRFSEVTTRMDEVSALLDGGTDQRRVDALHSIDVSVHNAGNAPPGFDRVTSQVVSVAQFEHPDFQRLAQLLTGSPEQLPWHLDRWPLGKIERKLWEWCYILRAAEQEGKLREDAEAIGFGVGAEPVPAALAKFGVRVLATDRAPDESRDWAESGQHMRSLESLSRPHLVSEDELARLVDTRYVDMNAVPEDLGEFDLIWSSCALEHLGTAEAGIEFVRRTLRNLKPGGLAVHTTELELTKRDSTAEYDHLVVYRVADLQRLRESVRADGFEMAVNWYVSLETNEDRWISIPPYDDERVHTKLLLRGESVSTSVGLMISKPRAGADG